MHFNLSNKVKSSEENENGSFSHYTDMTERHRSINICELKPKVK